MLGGQFSPMFLEYSLQLRAFMTKLENFLSHPPDLSEKCGLSARGTGNYH